MRVDRGDTVRSMAADRAQRVVRDELSKINLRLNLALWACHVLPPLAALRVRAMLLRAGGVSIGEGTVFGGSIRIEGSPRPAQNLRIGDRCWINGGCVFDTSAQITIGDRVALAQDVMVLTGTHEIGGPASRAGMVVNQPVRVGNGSWLGARAVILPGVVVGEGAIVAAGAVVTHDVEANTVVAGTPARVVRTLEQDRDMA
jgi:acetyltransferase-like isoleucine patch superfamily enzyme